MIRDKRHYENRIHLLSSKPLENARLIKKAERKLRALVTQEFA